MPNQHSDRFTISFDDIRALAAKFGSDIDAISEARLVQTQTQDRFLVQEFRIADKDAWMIATLESDSDDPIDLIAYRNLCPHRHIPLNWQPHDFIDEESGLIRCSSHGARFSMEDGYCVAGPCLGQSLQLLHVKRDEAGWTVLAP